jgi:hypothetical protein
VWVLVSPPSARAQRLVSTDLLPLQLSEASASLSIESMGVLALASLSADPTAASFSAAALATEFAPAPFFVPTWAMALALARRAGNGCTSFDRTRTKQRMTIQLSRQ